MFLRMFFFSCVPASSLIWRCVSLEGFLVQCLQTYLTWPCASVSQCLYDTKDPKTRVPASSLAPRSALPFDLSSLRHVGLCPVVSLCHPTALCLVRLDCNLQQTKKNSEQKPQQRRGRKRPSKGRHLVLGTVGIYKKTQLVEPKWSMSS